MKEPESTPAPNASPMNPPGQHHPDGAFDDPLHEWWQKNGKSLIAGALIVVIGTGLVFGFRAYRNSQETALQVAYNEAVATGDLASYAEGNAGYPLAGVAALQTANEAFAEENWERALSFYTLAADSLKGNPLSGKARLGIAISQSKLGEAPQAKNILATLAGDQTAFPAARAEALYFLSLLSLEAGDTAAFDQWSEQLAGIDQVGNWTSRLQYFADRIPIPVATPPASPDSPEATPTNPDESKDSSAAGEGTAAPVAPRADQTE